MILLVCGDGHTGGSQAVNQFDCAGGYLSELPHPENLAASWGRLLSVNLKAGFDYRAKHTHTNSIILNEAKEWVDSNASTEKILIIQWTNSTDVETEHENIWQFHLWLAERNIAHIFFNSYGTFSTCANQHDWGVNYITPYEENGTYTARLKTAGFDTVTNESPYFGADGHIWWGHFLLKYIIQNKLLS